MVMSRFTQPDDRDLSLVGLAPGAGLADAAAPDDLMAPLLLLVRHFLRLTMPPWCLLAPLVDSAAFRLLGTGPLPASRFACNH